MRGIDPEQAHENMEEFFRSFMLYEYPILDPNNRYAETFRRLRDDITRIGDRLKQEFPENLISVGLRGSYSHGHPYDGDDVDVLFIGENLTPDIEEVMLRITREDLEPGGFELCGGKLDMGFEVQPIRFLDLNQIEVILMSYMYGLADMLYREQDERGVVGRAPLAEKKALLLKSGILIPYLLWVYGMENLSRVFHRIAQYLPIPTRPTRSFSADIIDETKQTIRQGYIARTLTGQPIKLTKVMGYHLPEIEEGDWGSQPHREAEELFVALRPLRTIYDEAVRKHIIQSKIELEVIGRRLSPERIMAFAPSYDGLVRRRLRAQWGKWVNW